MKNYKLIISLLIIVMMVTSCSQTGESGELIGSTKATGSWFEPVPFGMAFIRRGSVRIGPSDQDPTGNISQTRTVSIDAFWMDDTEITNNEYRQFVNWVIDSTARSLLYNSSNPNAQYYGNLDDNGQFLSLSWTEPIDWKDTASLEGMFVPAQERFFGKREIDARKLYYEYAYIDYQKAAKRANSYNYKTQSYDGGIADRSAFIVRNRVNVYPDTLVWVRDFTYSYNEPWTSKYFWHPGFSEYPVVGTTWEQANAFCEWRSKMQNDFFSKNSEATVMEYRLPTEFEWEYAARGGLQNSMFPWGGYYSRNQAGEFMANYKPMRGNYIEDGGLTTMKVANYPPNDYGLYDMAGNVAEWTSSAYNELSMAQINELNPDFKYNALDSDPPALKRKVIRGGSWKDVGLNIQVSTRDNYEYQDSAKSFIGFRCVRSSFGNNF
jgi:gliding motility-associated lipoprotein GldK